ncbi:hypothetical protein [Natrinema gelatinilyticum]|uniref:hypothetical protein n=1 Tax=Natrinema gelatinilyticum TaxID=2961571 RepID=UPI0020C2177E|nr:hypothetical protein [Natrinema gelatinilyticum]
MPQIQPSGKPLRVVADGNRQVTIQKVHTPRGERLQFDASATDESIRLDAVALESVTWQESSEMADRAATVERTTTTVERAPSEVDELMIANEYGQVQLERVDDDAVHLRAPKLGHEITLDVDELEWLTVQDHETFTTFLEQPFGPEDHDHH